MNISYNWLKDYVNFDETPHELAEKLTESGFEVEEYYSTIHSFSGVVVGRVHKVSKHPNADKLSLCSVFDGNEYHQVICGAPNVEAEQYVPFAKVGAILPNGFKIKKAKIRGTESFGMICSKEELGLEKASEGIWAIEEELKIGSDFYEYLAKDQDYIFDLAITPNRPDCLSMIGIAREVAAITGNILKLPEVQINEDSSKNVNSYISIHIEDEEGCPRYAGRVILGVKIGPSPQWMQQKLEHVGVRPINNIVDITNFVLMEFGHPLHAFDLAEVAGSEIHVRSSHKGEKFITLDDKERTLPENTVMICDKKRAVAIGGIMGGQNSEVSDNTVDILLESAYFKPDRIARSGKKLGLSTEASQRFERGADPNGVIQAINRAASLMAEFAGGTITSGICDVYPKKFNPISIFFRPERVNRLLGSDLSQDLIIEKLKSIQLEFQDNYVIAPTYRVDLRKEVDIIEEVARLVNFSNLPSRTETEINYDINQPETETLLSFLRTQLLEIGINEAITNSMLKSSEAQEFKEGKPITILNPISDDMTTMRPSLLPGLLNAVSYNLNRNQSDVRLFEIGRIFKNYKDNELPDQPYSLCVVLTGRRNVSSWNIHEEEIDFYDIKGYLESFLEKTFLDNSEIFLYDESLFFERNETIAIRINDQIIGYCGKLKNEITTNFDIDHSVFAFTLDIDEILPHIKRVRKFDPIPKFPYVEKDFALVIDKSKNAADVVNLIQKSAGELLKHVEIFDIFEGRNIPAGKKSLAIRMRFQSAERTLSDDEVDKIFRMIIKRTTEKFQASLRN